jgi:lipopolysaccharide/colanic/teichoic acid biosynthesis glycosyltransferase
VEAPQVPLRVVLVGEPYEIAHAMQHPSLANPARFDVAGAVSFDQEWCDFPEQQIRSLVRQHQANALLVAGAVGRAALTLCGELAVVLGCRLLSQVPHTKDTALEPLLVWEAGSAFVELTVSSAFRRYDRLKRVLDILGAAAGLVVAAPVLAVLALLVRAESAGNPFFGHERIGLGGRRFRCWKLRTMYADAERRLNDDLELFEAYRANDFKLPDHEDPRITRLGRWLRKTSVDELPQLWNVLMGEMSLVGPRPIVAEELPHYRGEVLTLLSVRPGLTGAWAVNGRHHLAYPKRAEVELGYVRNRSLATDLAILVRTFRAVLDPGFARTDTPKG